MLHPELAKAIKEHDALVEALRIFLGFDKRFRIRVDGDFNEVEKMHGTIRALYDRVTEQS